MGCGPAMSCSSCLLIPVLVVDTEGLHAGGCVPAISYISCLLIPVSVVDPEGLHAGGCVPDLLSHPSAVHRRLLPPDWNSESGSGR